MAKVTMPLLSVEASGQFGKSVVFAKWKGIRYARLYIGANGSETAAQLVVRDYFKTAVGAWQAETVPNKALWTTYAQTNSLGESGFNLYVGKYCKFLQDHTGTPPTVTNTPPEMT